MNSDPDKEETDVEKPNTPKKVIPKKVDGEVISPGMPFDIKSKSPDMPFSLKSSPMSPQKKPFKIELISSFEQQESPLKKDEQKS